MLISHFYPNAVMNRFTAYITKHKFQPNFCTKDADLIYSGSVSQLDKAMAAKEIYKKPLICWVWDIPYCWPEWARNNKEISEHSWRSKYIRKIVGNLRRCDKVISSSKYTQRILREKYGIDSEQIYFYIDTQEIDSIPASKNECHIIQISRFALNKRFDVSIKAMVGIDETLVCVGLGNNSGLKRLAESLRVNVKFYCNVKRHVTISLLKRASVLVSPSIFEGWGATPIEALYCRIPVLLGELEVFRELYGNNVLYHKRDDPNDMREKLRYLLADRKLQNNIVDKCQPIISEFTIPKFVERWERVIA